MLMVGPPFPALSCSDVLSFSTTVGHDRRPRPRPVVDRLINVGYRTHRDLAVVRANNCKITAGNSPSGCRPERITHVYRSFVSRYWTDPSAARNLEWRRDGAAGAGSRRRSRDHRPNGDRGRMLGD